MVSIGQRLRHAWNAFSDYEERPFENYRDSVTTFGPRPHAFRPLVVGNKSIIGSIYTRLALDASSVPIWHVRKDHEGRFLDHIDSGLHYCLTQEANLDQGARALRQDVFQTLFDKGVCAIVPVDTSDNPNTTGSYEIQTLRVGEIVQWGTQSVLVSLYNEKVGYRQQIPLMKRSIAIVENPLYSVMNEPNSTLQRLLHKLSLLDAVDEQSSSGKLDLIIQLPYVIKSETRRQQAEQRRKDIELQLKGSQYGIAYTDGTERITQLNRPAENQLMGQVEYLTKMLYSQLGLTESIFDGTADERTIINYHNRTIEPLLTAFTEAMKRSFLTKTARTQGQSIDFFRDPFKYVSLSELAEMGDKLTRNEIVSSNEMRSVIGLRPSKDPEADKLRNKNIPAESQPSSPPTPSPRPKPDLGREVEEFMSKNGGKLQNGTGL